MTATKKRPGQWAPGVSGNPRGRPAGTGEVGRLRAAIAESLPDILAALMAAAKAGDVQACRLLLDRVLPTAKPVDLPQKFALPSSSLTDQGRAVLAAVAAGEIAPGQGVQLLTAISGLSRVVEIDEIAARLTALEAIHAKP
jgi:hypothetical protein